MNRSTAVTSYSGNAVKQVVDFARDPLPSIATGPLPTIATGPLPSIATDPLPLIAELHFAAVPLRTEVFSMSTDELIPLICQGDAEALGQFIEAHRQELLGLICHLCRPELQQVVPPEDLLQEIAASAIVALPRLASPQLEPLAWLRQLARRRIVDAHRFHFEAERRAVQRQRSLSSGQDSQPGWEALIAASLTSPSEAFSRNVRLSRLQQAISGLGHDAQQAIRMRYVDGLTSQQIAQKMDKSDAAIRVLLSRSLRKLQDLLRTHQ